jgi:hypothetical protein
MASWPKPRVKKWTPEDDTLLLELKAAKTPLKLIAHQLGRSKASVDSRARLLESVPLPRLRGRAWTRLEDSQLSDMLNAGTKISDIATSLGHTIRAIRDRIKNPVWRRGLQGKK